jgi:hypothetical protein
MELEVGTIAQFVAGSTVKCTVKKVLSETVLELETALSSAVGATNTANTRGGTNVDTYYVALKGTFRKAVAGIFNMISNDAHDKKYP